MNTAQNAIALGQHRTAIRSIGVAKINRLTRAAPHLPELLNAFTEWSEGEIYVCKKTQTYRYRFGDRSKSVAPWSAIARELFPTPSDFAFAAAVFAQQPHQDEPRQDSAPATPPGAGSRVNVIHMTQDERRAA